MTDGPTEDSAPVPPVPSGPDPGDRATDTPVRPVTAAARDLGGGSPAFDFFSSVVAGLLLGLGIDWLAGTSPWFTVAGIVAGFVSGFTKLWVASRVLVDQAEERRVRRHG
jgi:hypothetical protein